MGQSGGPNPEAEGSSGGEGPGGRRRPAFSNSLCSGLRGSTGFPGPSPGLACLWKAHIDPGLDLCSDGDVLIISHPPSLVYSAPPRLFENFLVLQTILSGAQAG